MKQRLLIAMQAILAGIFVLTSCTKRSGIDEQLNGPPYDLIKNMAPNPMPPDTLELDSLERPPFL